MKPIMDRVLIKMIDDPRMTPGGIALPDVDRDEEDLLAVKTGIVIAVGPGLYQNGQLIPCDVVEGDVVHFLPMGGSQIYMDGNAFIYMRQGDLLAKGVDAEPVK